MGSGVIWISGDDRACVLRPFAMRLWDARDRAKVTGDTVEFDGCTYEGSYSDSNEFSTGSSRLRADGNTFMMAWGSDPLTRAFDAVAAWKMIRHITGYEPHPPAVIHVPAGPPVERRKAGLLGRMFGLTETTFQPAYDITDPMQLARHEFGRLLHAAVTEERAHPRWGVLTMTVARGIEVWTNSPMRAVHPRAGETRIHPSWAGPIMKAIRANQMGDSHWVAQERRAASEPDSHMEYT